LTTIGDGGTFLVYYYYIYDRMHQTDNDITISITPKSPDSRWVTLDENNDIISEGKTPGDAIEAAKQSGKGFTLMFVPEEGNTCFF
jgi:hypothetical protein